MGNHFQMNENMTYQNNPYLKKNEYWNKTPDVDKVPTYDEAKDFLPRPVWEGHKSAIDCYDKTWQIAFRNLRVANADAGFVSNFIDTAFNGYLFMWDSSFIVMFGKYGSRAFDFQKTLDNFYSHQHVDGFICREICESEKGEQFTRDDPSSTGPNILPWAEWRYYCSTGDKDRLSKVFDPLCAYHWWLQMNRSWPDGSYWSTGWGCGMDNQPRQQPGYDVSYSHGHMSWIDTCAQMYLSATILCKMAKELGREDEVEWLKKEQDLMNQTINGTMWDDQKAFYFDKYRDGSLSDVKTIGAYWTLLSGLVPEERKERFIAHLNNEKEFKRKNRVPTLSADHPKYDPKGSYWCGSVWAPTNYMVMEALNDNGYKDLAHDIAVAFHTTVVKVFEDTNTLWENYAPDFYERGNHSADDFVGWTGLAPITVLFEHVFGIQPDAQKKHIEWTIRLTEKHGIENYALGDATVSLLCDARSSVNEKPVVQIQSDKPITVDIIWNGEKTTILAGK